MAGTDIESWHVGDTGVGGGGAGIAIAVDTVGAHDEDDDGVDDTAADADSRVIVCSRKRIRSNKRLLKLVSNSSRRRAKRNCVSRSAHKLLEQYPFAIAFDLMNKWNKIC